jgi:hypothetical protein
MPHSIQLVQLSGLLHRRATCCIDTSESRSGSAESRFHRVPLAEASTNGSLYATPVAAIATRTRTVESWKISVSGTKLAINSPSKLACFGPFCVYHARGKAR